MSLRLRAEELEWRQVDDEIVILDARKGTYLAINGSGALLWPALAPKKVSCGRTGGQAGRRLRDRREGARADTAEFVTSLQERDLLAA